MPPYTQKLTLLLFMIGLGGALISSSILAAATLLLAIAGIAICFRKSQNEQAWEKPKELRLLHFAFWFFVAVSAYSWVLQGFSYEGGKTLGTQALLLLFWPLVIALSYAKLRPNVVFFATGLAALSVVTVFIAHFASYEGSLEQFINARFGDGINAISFGNTALLAGTMALVGGLFFSQAKRSFVAGLFFFVGALAIAVSMLAETRGSLIALPFLLLLLAPLFERKYQLAGIVLILILVIGAIATSDRMSQSIEALVQGFNFNNAITSGIPGILSWAFLIFIPLITFLRHIFSKHSPAAHIAIAGAMVATGYFFFGLTEVTFSRSLFLTFYLLSIAAISTALFNELSASYVRDRTRKVSATIITKNEADNIAACLQSARLVADEIIVLDSGSSDATVEIARKYADVVEVTDWPGFGIQKQRALEKATGEWVLSIDADERITPELAREINHHLSAPDADAYKLPWAVTLYGTRLDFGRSGRAPLRLFRRKGVRFSNAMVHEKILIPEGRKTKTLRGRLTHYTHRHFGHALEKSAKYAWLGSQEKFRKGKKTRTLVYPTFRGLLTFFQVYIIRFGFLDGSVGFLVAVTYAQGSFNKYAGLWTLSRSEKIKPASSQNE
ncbi:MAG: glycosyltransferase family 2 protein [Marinobacter sp.]